MSSPFEQVATASLRVHDALILWARTLLREAGLEAVEVYGQFPPEGTVAHHIVLFPYALGPDPKLQQNAPAVALENLARRDVERRLPGPWLSLSSELAEVCEVLGGKPVNANHRPGHSPQVELQGLTPSLQAWYEQSLSDPDPWVVGPPGARRACLPTLLWRSGFVLSVRYVVVAADVGRGTYDRTSVGAPMSLPALSVLASGLHLRRTIVTPCPPIPVPDRLASWVAALTPQLRDRLTPLVEECRAEMNAEVSLNAAQDLTTQEFALLMQALQRPLQAALNLQMRFRLADFVDFRPSASIHHTILEKWTPDEPISTPTQERSPAQHNLAET